MKLSDNSDIPVLKGWVNMTEASEMLGITRQHAYKLSTQGAFKTLHRIGTQPSFVISVKEIELKLRKKASDAEGKESEKENA